MQDVLHPQWVERVEGSGLEALAQGESFEPRLRDSNYITIINGYIVRNRLHYHNKWVYSKE